MGYMGIGMQGWISKMKPRKYFGGRSKPDGGGGENLSGIDMKNYYHYKTNKLERLLQKKYSPGYQKKLRKELRGLLIITSHQDCQSRLLGIHRRFPQAGG